MSLGRVTTVLLALGAMNVPPADAQSLMAGGGVEASVQRFPGAVAPNRLDGTTGGLTGLFGVRRGPLVVRLEGSHGGTIADVVTTSVTVDSRPLSIRSELAHNRQALGALGGYVRDLSAGITVAAVGGVSFVSHRRTFTTNAGQLLLSGPSTVPPTRSTQVDESWAWNIGADVFFRLTPHVRMMAGVRVEPLTLAPDVSGRSVRTLAGVVWVR